MSTVFLGHSRQRKSYNTHYNGSTKTQAPFQSSTSQRVVLHVTKRSRQVNSAGVTPSVRRQGNNSWQHNRRVNKTQLRKTTFLRTTLSWKPAPSVCLSVPHLTVIHIHRMPGTRQWSYGLGSGMEVGTTAITKEITYTKTVM